jgi:nitroimidazol reductase NimA-like FMN-containing flavoprotein (pyridoxamine 5'-phosphate oxidase superfamily)
VLGRLREDQIEDVLRTATTGRIGCRDGDAVYVVPISFVCDDGCVYGHSAEGRKLTLMRATPEVCFEVEDVRGLSDWRSVIARGIFEELHGDEARTALDLLASRFAPLGTRPEPGTPPPSHGYSTSMPPVLFRIRLLSTTGRFESTACRPARAPPLKHLFRAVDGTRTGDTTVRTSACSWGTGDDDEPPVHFASFDACVDQNGMRGFRRRGCNDRKR